MTAFELSYKSSTLVLLAALAACGGGDGGGSGGNSGGGGSGTVTPVATYAISGEVTGLAAGKSVLLRNNGVDELSVAKSGSFKFGSRVETGKAYAVTVVTQPQGQSCQVQAGSGTATGDVSNIKVRGGSGRLNNSTQLLSKILGLCRLHFCKRQGRKVGLIRGGLAMRLMGPL
nr:hypothetical protein [Comamonas testosteroni]